MGAGAQAHGLGERGGALRVAGDDPLMEKFTGYLAGERKTNGKRSNCDGFDKRDTLRCKGRRDLPCGGGG